MIKVIKGCIGVVIDNKNTLKTPQDEPFSCGADLEERFVTEGFAEYVDAEAVVTPVADLGNGEDGQQDENEDEAGNAFSELSYTDLKAEVAKRGLTPASQKKDDLIAALIADNEKEDEEIQTDETDEQGEQIDLGNGEDGVN